MKDAPPIPTVLWEQLLARKKPKKARAWVARWLDRNGVEAVYAEPFDLFLKLGQDIERLKVKSQSGGSTHGNP